MNIYYYNETALREYQHIDESKHVQKTHKELKKHTHIKTNTRTHLLLDSHKAACSGVDEACNGVCVCVCACVCV